MAWDTQEILRSFGAPVPQYYNPTTDKYEVLQGVNGAARHILYGADGNPVSVVSNKLAVRASEIEAILGTTNDTAVIDPTLTASEIALLKGLLKQMRGEGTAGKSMPVQLTGSNMQWTTIELSNPSGDLIAHGTSKVYYLSSTIMPYMDEIVVNYRIFPTYTAHTNKLRIAYYDPINNASYENVDLLVSGSRGGGISARHQVRPPFPSTPNTMAIVLSNEDVAADYTYRVWLTYKKLGM
ncbi:MAG: hypothetical protein ABFD04_11735 [Syntrophomonas sp.]